MIILYICTGELYTVSCSPTDAELVATGGGDDKGFLWRIGRGDWAFELQGMSMRKKLWDFCSTLFIIVHLNVFQVVRHSFVWYYVNFSPFEPLLSFCAGHKDSLSSLAFSTDGKLLASGSFDGIIQIWDVAGNLKGTLEGPSGGIEVRL